MITNDLRTEYANGIADLNKVLCRLEELQANGVEFQCEYFVSY